jgi:hypothetical protein
MRKVLSLLVILAFLLALLPTSIAFADSEVIWQIGTFDNSRNELKGDGLTGIYELDFDADTQSASEFPGTLYYASSTYDYRGVHKVNIHFTLDKPYKDVRLVYGRAGDETDEITLDMDGTLLATIAGTENSWDGSPYQILIGELAPGAHTISIEVTAGGILDDAHVVDALQLLGSPSTYDLIAGQTDDIGDVYAWDDGENLYIKYVSDGLCLTETHLEVANALGDIPQTKKGNPIPGKFSESAEYQGCVTESDTYVFPLESCNYIAAHASTGAKETKSFYSDGVEDNGNVLVTAGNVFDVTYPYLAVDAWEAFGDPDDSGDSTWDSRLTLNGSPFSFIFADWIWEEYRVVDPKVVQDVGFEYKFNVPGFPMSGKVFIATDNMYSASMNGEFLGDQQVYQNWPQVGEYSFYPASGENTLAITGTNYGDPSYTLDNNPAGLIFEGEYSYITEGDTAWGVATLDPLGTQFDGNNWATYFTYGTCQ